MARVPVFTSPECFGAWFFDIKLWEVERLLRSSIAPPSSHA
jgi:hypothetical protein